MKKGKVIYECPIHGATTHHYRINTTRVGEKVYQYEQYRCYKCAAVIQLRRKQTIKATLVAEHGGQCKRCGYNKSIAALEFHHRDRAEKEANIASFQSLTRARAEALKCDLICSNCHRELHAVKKVEEKI